MQCKFSSALYPTQAWTRSGKRAHVSLQLPTQFSAHCDFSDYLWGQLPNAGPLKAWKDESFSVGCLHCGVFWGQSTLMPPSSLPTVLCLADPGSHHLRTPASWFMCSSSLSHRSLLPTQAALPLPFSLPLLSPLDLSALLNWAQGKTAHSLLTDL